MKAYHNNGHLTSDQKKFNFYLSKARMVVEHSYGRLKGRWRCLLKRLDVGISDAPVGSCCLLRPALQKVCEFHGEEFNE